MYLKYLQGELYRPIKPDDCYWSLGMLSCKHLRELVEPYIWFLSTKTIASSLNVEGKKLMEIISNSNNQYD